MVCIMDFSKIRLDTTSEYIIDLKKGMCNVMIEGEILEVGHILAGTSPEEAYVDGYCYIDPLREIVTQLLFIVKKEDGTQEEFPFLITNPVNWVEIFKTLKSQGGKEFEEFLTDATVSIYMQNEEIEAEFLTEVREAVRKSDNSTLRQIFRNMLDISHEGILRDKIEALQKYYCDSYDEDGFYTELSEMHISKAMYENIFGKEKTEHAEAYMVKHGLEWWCMS